MSIKNQVITILEKACISVQETQEAICELRSQPNSNKLIQAYSKLKKSNPNKGIKESRLYV